jgi:hypothetical protein
MKHRRSRSRDRNHRPRRDSDSDRSSSSLYSSDDHKAPAETNTALELYKRLKRERHEASAINVHCRALDLEADFPNYKRKLVV